MQNRKKTPNFGAIIRKKINMNHRFFKTGSLGVLIGMMSLKEIVGVVPVHKIQGDWFCFALISNNACQGVFGIDKSLKRNDEKLEKEDLFGGYSLEINLWAIVTLLYSENKSLLQGHDQEKLQAAMETGMFVDIDTDKIYQQAKKYADENE